MSSPSSYFYTSGWIRMFTFLLVVSFARVTRAQEVETTPCYTNLTDLREDITAKDPFAVVEYILCPNTEFRFDGENPQKVLRSRSNIRVLCGEDGSSKNNCTLAGALVSAITCRQTEYAEKIKENVYYSGLTLGKSGVSQFVGSCEGDVTFHDCIFEGHTDSSLSSVTLNTNIAPDDDRRSLQDEVPHLVTTFDSCLFQFNSHGTAEGSFQEHTVIDVENRGHKVVIKNSIFHENYFNDIEQTSSSKIIFLEHPLATLELKNNCFLLNDVMGKGTVLVQNTDQVTAERNFGTYDAGLQCQFIHVGSTNECVEYDLDSCPLDFEFEDVPAPDLPAPAPAPASASIPTTTAVVTQLLIGFVLLLL